MASTMTETATGAPDPTQVLATSNEAQYDKHLVLPNGHVSGFYKRGTAKGLPLIVVIHGGGCNSKYMDRPGYSYVEDAATLGRGCSIMLVNRPGYGGTKGTDSLNPIEASIPHLVALIKWIWDEETKRIEAPGVVLFGHSIGGATTYTIAAEPELPFPLLGIAVSGFAIHHSIPIKAFWVEGEGQTRNKMASEKLRNVAYGPPDTYDPEAKRAAAQGGEPPVQAELIEISHAWPERFHTVAGRIRVPLWHGLAEFENLWKVGPEAFEEMRPSYRLASRVELVELPEGGHAYSFHKRGKEMHAMQFAFALSCVPATGL
ncbi:hypothetical protein NKR23_g6636 [Pleurostoma richardsiae]|uniref:AB hydrolase-1 domain-containing protein n=1 Tax=Pleurostoma richardsiae TaxID=41990 RepID=A0AA38RYK9_9PEZI|nr:hypothetical protein NKR23_g6636 [Pleurostoma richardsiae]